MSDFEGRLESVVPLWPEAANEKADITRHREAYSVALRYRADVGQAVRNQRALRNAAKEAFITEYAEITSRVGAEFPRDSAMQDLFFDDVRTKTAMDEADEENESDTSDGGTTSESTTG